MITRRQFLQATASLALAPMLPYDTFGATSLRTRPSWSNFRKGSLYPSFLAAVGKMRANQDATKPGSWAYWTGVHASFCPHRKPYFLAWHRGFLARFEAQLQVAAGNSALVLPYWDYYSDPTVPAEFRDPGSPLYLPKRAGEDVSGALSLAAFGPGVVNFQRGATDAFEPAVESAPHNGVHNLIGGAMGNLMVSPRDPLFWLHHASIDRLWDAWVQAGYGRHMPGKTASYWSGSFAYGPAVAGVKRVSTYAPSILGYRYADSSLPSSLPGALQVDAAQLSLIQDASGEHLPAQGSSLGGIRSLALGPRSTRVRIPLAADGRNRVRTLMTRAERQPTTTGDSLRIVLDGVRLTQAGAQGGYFYKVLLDLPTDSVTQPEQAYLVGTLGPFEVGVALHAGGMTHGHMAMNEGTRIVLPAAHILRRIWPTMLETLSLSFVRVDAGTAVARDTTMVIERLWVEAEG